MITGFARATLIAVASLFMFLLGLIVVAGALPFAKAVPGTKKPFTQFPGEWELVRLPRWALWWDNPVDGMLGDRRGWWDNYCLTNYGTDCRTFYAMWQWAAIRNSSNYWSRITTGVDSYFCNVSLVANGKYWQLLRGDWNKKVYPLFEGFIPYADGKHGLEWRIGWKLDPGIPEPNVDRAERCWGSVFRIRPWKAI